MSLLKKQKMLDQIKDYYGLKDPKVLNAIKKVPREHFLPKAQKPLAYEDQAIPIGHGQTMSQPYTVAVMTSLLDLKGNEKVLEIGTGSGYQAAVLSHLAKKVYTVELIKPLAQRAAKKLKQLKLDNVHVKHAQGQYGWPEHAPYDALLATAGLNEDLPEELINQTSENGIIVAPVRGILTRFRKKETKLKKEAHGRFAFVPFVTD